MAVVELVHPDGTFEVTAQRLVTHWSLFSSDPSLTLAPYAVRSSVSLLLLRDFVAALEDGPLTIGNENVRGLSLLCAEFGFWSLAAKVSAFRSSPLAVRLRRVSSARLRSRLAAALGSRPDLAVGGGSVREELCSASGLRF
jgi:hypothetical protein